jgi:hypothetical protein
MRYFWYISQTKVDHLASQQETAFDRLRASLSALIKAEVKTPIASIGVEMKRPEVDPNQIRILERVEKKLRNAGLVKSIEDFHTRKPVLFFQFHGPAARLVQDGQFWLATLVGETAILLAGSAAHCIGGSNPISNAISPSADPLGSIESFLNPGSAEGEGANNLSYIWATVARESIERLGGFEALPYAKGIAISAGSAKSDLTQITDSGYEGPIDRIIIGSPIFVEQAAS